MFGLLRESVRRHIALARRYDHLRRVYREALPVLSSKQKWETVLFVRLAGLVRFLNLPYWRHKALYRAMQLE